MRKVLVLTDSTCDLTPEIIEKRNLSVIPLYVNFGEESYLDGVTLTTMEMYQKVKETGILPSSAAPSPHVFIEFLEPYVKNGHDVVFTGIGSKLSGTGKNYLLAISELKETYPEAELYYIDSGNLSTAIGLIALKMADLRDAGKSAKEIYETLKDIAPRVHSQFVLKTLDYMKKGGRASGMQALIGAAFQIKPVLRTRDGELFLYKNAMGKLSRGMDIQLTDFFYEYDRGNIVDDYLFVTHTDSQKTVEYTKKKLAEHGVKVKHLYETHAGCVISSHCGPGTIGILYEVKEYDSDRDSGRPKKK